ncbi:MAG: DMT family transporter [Candidatus Kariarchaeaceae archaeon]|jgi:drug/metabolite transporter (DMT)-like permease
MSEIATPKSFNFGPLFIASAAFLWTTDVFVRGNLENKLIANQLVFLEHVIIILILLPLVYKYLPALLGFDRKQWGALLFIGVGGSAMATIFLTIGFFMGEWPYQYAAVVVLLQQVQPIFAIGFAHLILKERLPRNYYLFGIFAIIGVLLIILPMPTSDLSCNNIAGDSVTVCSSGKPFSGISTFTSDFKHDEGVKASLFGLLAAFLWGTSTVFGRYLLEHGKERLEYFQMTTYRFLIALIFLFGLTTFVDISSSQFDQDIELINYKFAGFPDFGTLDEARVITSILYISLIVGLLSLILYYYGLRTTHASISAIFELAFPLSFFIVVPTIQAIQPKLELFNRTIYDLGSYVLELHILQLIGAALLLVSSTALSYTYAKSHESDIGEAKPTAVE